MKQVIVVCGIIIEKGKVLCVLRERESLEGGNWEFPGGKVEFGESPPSALKRELMEELSIDTNIENPVAVSSAIIDQKHYVMIAFQTSIENGEIELNVGQEYRWVGSNEFRSMNFAALDVPMLDSITYLLTDVSRNL